MSLPVELGRPVRLPETRNARVSEPTSLKGLLGLMSTAERGAPPAPARERTVPTVGVEGLQQRLRASQPAARPTASAMGSKGAWGVAAHSLAGTGAYQTTNESYEEDGVSYEKTTNTGPKGYNSTTVTYEKDGVSYVETTTSSNGTTTVRVEATSGDTTEVSTSRTTTVPGDLADYVDSDTLGGIQADPENGVGVTTRTDNKTEVIDNSQNPPVITVVQQSTGYTQQLDHVQDLEGGQEVYAPDGASLDNQTVSLPEGQYDQSNSGLYVSYTTQTIPEPGSVLQSETRITGTGSDGHPIFYSNSRTVATNAQGEDQVTLRVVEKGTISRADAEEAYLDKMRSNDEELAARFASADSPWLDFESSTVYSGDGVFPVITAQFGELNQPGQDSISATKVEEGENKYTTFQQVSEGGKRVQSETHVPGTNFRSVSDTRYGQDGEYTTISSSYSGNTQISSSESSRELLYDNGAPLPSQAPQGFSQEQWDEFRKAHPNGPVYRDQVEGWELGLDGQKTTTQGDNFSVNGSVVGFVHQNGPAAAPDQEYLQLDGEHPSGQLVIDGVAVAIDSEGTVTWNGEEVLADTNLLVQGQAGLEALTKALKTSPKLLEKLPDLGPGGGALNVLSGTIQTITADNWGDRLGGAASLTGGASEIIGVFNTIGRLGTVAKVAGVAGGALQVGQGALEIFQHNYAEGAADAVSGAATSAAILLAASNPALAVVFGAVAVVSGITRLILDWGDEEEKKPAYDLYGAEPHWSFGG